MNKFPKRMKKFDITAIRLRECKYRVLCFVNFIMKRRHSVARARSVTPGPENRPKSRQSVARRQLIMANAENCERDVFVEPEPKLWKPPSTLLAHRVNRTPGGSLHMCNTTVPLDRTPKGSLRRKQELEESIHVTTIERAAACDMDDEEGEAILQDNYDHVRKWVSELPPPEDFAIQSSPSKPESQVSCDSVSGTVSVHAVEQPLPGPSGACTNWQLNVAHVDERPSTSGEAAASRGHTRLLASAGSDFDSDFDDEFDLNEIAALAGINRGIPENDELEEPVANIISSVERAMDEAIEEMVGVSTDFNWQEDFDTFRGVPETFSGPAPGSVKDYDTPYEAFTDIWSRDFIEHIVKETNRYARQEIDKLVSAGTLTESSRLRRWVDTDVDEIYVLFAVYIFMGIDSRSSQHEYFKAGGFLEMPRFRQLLSYNRFLLLNKFLHFVDNADESQQLPHSEGNVFSSRLRKIAPLLSHLNAKFQSLYSLHQDIAIDESLTLFKGRLSWVQAIRSKAARFGIKSYELCESRTGYLDKFDIYTGKNDAGSNTSAAALSADLGGKSTQVVLDLLKGLERRGHCVTMDNFYNSPALARYLKSLGFDCLGTLRANRKNVPKDIAKAPKNVPKGTIIGRHSGDVSCIAWKDSKMVNMISTYHTAETFEGRKAGRVLVKPVAVRDYNNTMGGVDLKDQKLSMYLMERKRCLKWYMKIFKRLLNVSVHNSLVLLLSSLKRRNMSVMTHRDFRYQLANSLVEVHRPSLQPISAPVSEVTRLRRDIVHEPNNLSRTTRKYCHLCQRKGTNKKVSSVCVTCDVGLCFAGCWKDWHSLERLPGKNVVKRVRRQHNE